MAPAAPWAMASAAAPGRSTATASGSATTVVASVSVTTSRAPARRDASVLAAARQLSKHSSRVSTAHTRERYFRCRSSKSSRKRRMETLWSTASRNSSSSFDGLCTTFVTARPKVSNAAIASSPSAALNPNAWMRSCPTLKSSMAAATPSVSTTASGAAGVHPAPAALRASAVAFAASTALRTSEPVGNAGDEAEVAGSKSDAGAMCASSAAGTSGDADDSVWAAAAAARVRPDVAAADAPSAAGTAWAWAWWAGATGLAATADSAWAAARASSFAACWSAATAWDRRSSSSSGRPARKGALSCQAQTQARTFSNGRNTSRTCF
mmetsp:Transcript_7478/g.23240  ORF Transcript_7478/g.23240 Transcript_7478/m.23240 type:complete len:324 (-) Transcript_7478:319-1290(-)